MVIFSSSLFLVCNWSGICQSPGTCPWSSSQKRQVGEGSMCHGQRGQMVCGLARESEQAVRNKNFNPICPSPCLTSVLSDSQGTCPRWGTPLLPKLQSETWVYIKKRKRRNKSSYLSYS